MHRSAVSFDPNRPYFAPYGLTCVHWKPSPMRRPDHHNEIELNFLEAGTVTYLLGGRKTLLQSGQLSAFWAAIPHQIIDYSTDVRYFVATIPLQCFLQWRLPDALVQNLLQGRLINETTTRRAAADAQLFDHWEDDLTAPGPNMERAVLLEMQARLMRLAIDATTPSRTTRKRARLSVVPDGSLNKVEQMACFIAQNYTEQLTVQQIGDVVKLHRNYAMNLFQRTFGTTLINYLTQHRVSHAQRLLATTEESITDIGFSSGFNSISRFNHAFRRACGCSPREYRRSHRL